MTDWTILATAAGLLLNIAVSAVRESRRHAYIADLDVRYARFLAFHHTRARLERL